MHLELTVVDGRRGAPGADVVVEAADDACLDDVLGDLAAVVGCEARAVVAAVAGRPVPGRAPLGRPPLVRGAVVALQPLHAGSGVPESATSPESTTALRVVAGPDAGLSAPLPVGRAVVGRDPSGLLPLSDRTASRRHVELDTSPSGTRVRDLGSANGSLLDGRPLPPTWTPLVVGARLRLGSCELQLARCEATAGPPRAVGRRAAPDGRGHLLLAPVPPAGDAADVEAPPAVVDLPEVPLLRPTAPVSWPSVLVPVAVAVPLALLWSPLALLLALSGPLVALLTRATERRTHRRQHALDLHDHAEAVVAARTRAERLLARERELLEQRHPDPAAVAAAVSAHGQLLWAAPAGAPLAVRLGTGTRPSGVALRGEPAGRGQDGDEPLRHRCAPVVTDLAQLSSVVLCAPEEVGLGVLRCVVGQLAALHSPADLALRVVTDRPGAWAWLRWVPHARPAPRPAVAPVAPVASVTVVDVDGDVAQPAPPGGRGCVLRLLRGRSGHSEAADAVLQLDADGVGTWSGQPLVADQVGLPWAWALARGLAPLRPAGAAVDDGEPPSLRELLAAHGPDPCDAVAVAAAWSDPGRRRSAVPLGVHADGRPWLVDLARDGPHALFAGTTGSGKSSLLVVLVLALAAAAPPDELAVVVVDYKGGSTAGRLQGLPHLAGAVTDLDAHLARRALSSLAAEVRRRERVLREHGASDRDALLAQRPDGARVLPRLLVVVDEVRVLVEEVPELVPGLVRLAAVGRSLGVHLVLATQRPAGVVSADARANTNLRVALRVRDEVDSADVVDDAGAAHLPPGSPGSALVRRGGEPLERVRAASTLSRPPVRTAVLPAPSGVVPPRAGTASGEGGDDVPRIVAALRRAARGVPSAAPPWLPPLPDALPWRSAADAPGSAADGLPLGLLDVPELPAQQVVRWRPERPLVVVGGPGSGRTSLLRWSAVALGEVHPLQEVHVVGSPDELGDLAALPWVASVVDPSDGEHLLRVLGAVCDLQRRGDPASVGAPAPVLLVDRADRVLAASADAGAGPAGRAEADAAADLLRQLLDAGAPAVLTGDPGLLVQRAVGGVRDALLLAPADPAAAQLAGVPRAAVPVHWPPGRALRLRAGAVLECQLPVLGGVDGAADASVQRAAVARAVAAPPGLRSRVPALPRRLTADVMGGLLLSRGWVGAAGELPVGVGGRGVDPVGLPLPPGATAVVAGPPGSGRTSALLQLAQQAERAGRPVVRVSPLDGTGAASAQRLLEAVATSPEPVQGALVLVDDAELVLGDHLEQALLSLLEAQEGSRRCAVVAAGTCGQLPVHRGLVAALRRSRTGLLLHPLGPGDAELLGTRPSAVRGGPPGRAGLVVGGSLRVVQLALPR